MNKDFGLTGAVDDDDLLENIFHVRDQRLWLALKYLQAGIHCGANPTVVLFKDS